MYGSRDRAALLREIYREIIITIATVFDVSKRLPEEIVCELDRRLRALYRRQCSRCTHGEHDRRAEVAGRPHPD